MALTVNAAQISFAKATSVVSGAQKLVVPVPAFAGGGLPLVYPTGHAQAGQPITDWQGMPIGGRGIVFFNDKDQKHQAAKGDGTAVVIMAQVPGPLAAELIADLNALGALESIAVDDFSAFLDRARARGLGDMYNSDDGFIAAKMTPVTPDANVIQTARGTFGHLKRDDRDIWSAVYVSGDIAFYGSGQSEGDAQLFPNGMVVVKSGANVHGIQPNEFAATYRLADGTAITEVMTQLVAAEIQEAARASE